MQLTLKTTRLGKSTVRSPDCRMTIRPALQHRQRSVSPPSSAYLGTANFEQQGFSTPAIVALGATVATIAAGADPLIAVLGSLATGALVSEWRSVPEGVSTARRGTTVRDSQAALLEANYALSKALEEVETQKALLRQSLRQVELLRHDVTAHKHAKQNRDACVRERNSQLFSLRLRLELQKRSPGCLDIEQDPAIELATDRIVKDQHIRLLVKENAELVSRVGELEACLDIKCGAYDDSLE